MHNKNKMSQRDATTSKISFIYAEIIFCIFGCATIDKYRNEILKIKDTWGIKAASLKYKILFFLGEEKTTLIGDDYIYLDGVGNDYSSASDKQNLGLKYIYERYVCDFVYICGTDTYVVIDNLKSKIKDWNKNENICIGGHGDFRKINNIETYFHSGGPGLIISYKSLSLIYDELEEMLNNWKKEKKDEDLNNSCDVAICYYLKKKTCKFIKEDRLFFHCNYLGYPCHEGLKTGIIACHNMKLIDFDDYDKLLANSTTDS